MAVGCLIFTAIVVFLFVSSSGSKPLPSKAAGTRGFIAQKRDSDYLLSNGVAARGILLQVSSTPDGKVLSRGSKLEQRTLRLDIEVPGQTPYELNSSVFIPTQLSETILPGAIVELRVDPQDPTQIMVYGPGVGLALAPFAQPLPVVAVAAPPAAPIVPSEPELPAVAAPTPRATAGAAPGGGLGTCLACGAVVNLPEVQDDDGRCPTCGALWR